VVIPVLRLIEFQKAISLRRDPGPLTAAEREVVDGMKERPNLEPGVPF
jgi:hypothetical protein